ncbi:Zn(2)-C6 fungal-type domain-containing protein [Mycena indigotica]|uniref:Zn(2)-C6 fungal-type domain-containing protein n=1 Tax=Mycena indigotica TaxID=2126181 RepID=A0A8H6W3R8_9AGAR|nr:Zn(2)-C6 fungal-type domain-containing protein [Mycena indigotica]KAF7303857.1 Zn(2)-C6 fungal-type domain-containing protein [Mycena indigotica]
MPVDKSKQQKTTPKRSKDSDYISPHFIGSSGLTHARELEVKRSRGEVSCAECRRLKIKCDKQIPCQSCVRRGCSALCPNGALATGQGTRFVLAATEHLHRKIARMGERIRALEDALTTLHAAQGGPDRPIHPLLVDSEDFSLPDEPPTPRRGVVEEESNNPSRTSGNGDVIDAFGTLSISDHGISRFFGPTGGSESLLIASSPSPTSSPSSLSLSRSSDSLSPPSSHASSPDSPSDNRVHSIKSDSSIPALALFSANAFPLTPFGTPSAIRDLVTSHLPPRAHGRLLIDSYFAQLAWLFRGVTRGQVKDMMCGIYSSYGPTGERDDFDDLEGDEDQEGDPEDHTGPHDLALLFMIFATGALVQPQSENATNLPPDEEEEIYRKRVSAEGEHFHQIARAALALQPVLEKPSIVTIQALHLLSIYYGMATAPNYKEDAETSMEMTWSLITLAAHLSQTIGLHRDSARWGLSPKMVQRRRILFWDLFVADVWLSLNNGRPPSFSLAYIDCSFPTYEGSRAKEGAFEIWQFRFAAECVADVTARTLTAEAPGYSTIMELDKKVREFPLPPLDDVSPDDLGASLQRCVLEHIRETGSVTFLLHIKGKTHAYTAVLLYIHRSFFAQAIIEQPVNPLKSAYAPSFLAAYRASATILKSVRDQFEITPIACARFWTMWTFAFSSAVVFGTVVTRGPRSPLANAAMTELEQACILFSKAAVHSRRAMKALPILTKLSEKARHALVAAQNDPMGGDDKGGLLWNMQGVLGPGGQPVQVKTEELDDELTIFAGHTRFVSGQLQRGSPVKFPSRRQLANPPMHTDDQLYGRSDRVSPQQHQYPVEPPIPPRQRLHSMPSSSDLHQHHDRSTVNVNIDSRWGARDYAPDAAHSYAYHSSPHSAIQEQIPHQQQLYHSDGNRIPRSIPPTPSAPYAWPVDGYEGQHLQQPPPTPHHHPQYSLHQQYPSHDHAYPHPQQASAFQAHNTELAQLGLAARDSRLDERWSHFMEDSGLLEGIDFRAR